MIIKMASIVQGLVLCALVSLAAAAGCERYCYTRWLDRDNPSGKGDYETLSNFQASQVCPRPVGIQCETVSGKPYKSTGEVLAIDCEPRRGLACQNADQPDGRCEDYRVRFLCPEGTIAEKRGLVCGEYCETQFFDRDDPSGKCDCEQLSLGPYTGPAPVGIRCIDRATGKDHQDIGQKMTCKPDVGGVCWNSDNPGNQCKDYLVQYIHPCNGEQLAMEEEVEMESESENYEDSDSEIQEDNEEHYEDSDSEVQEDNEEQKIRSLLYSLLSEEK